MVSDSFVKRVHFHLSTSFFVECEDEAEHTRLFAALSDRRGDGHQTTMVLAPLRLVCRPLACRAVECS